MGTLGVYFTEFNQKNIGLDRKLKQESANTGLQALVLE